MGTLNETDYVAFVGIDWADAKHDVCIQGLTVNNGSSRLFRTRWNGLMSGHNHYVNVLVRLLRWQWN